MQFHVTMTLGPASEQTRLRRRLAATADRFRINTSFCTPLQIKALLRQLSDLYGSLKQPLPLVLDLQGAKMRIGDYPDCPQLPPQVTLSHVPASRVPELIPVPHRELFAQCRCGDCLLLNDGRITLEVFAVGSNVIQAAVIKNGPLSKFKSINRAEHPLHFNRPGERDLAMLAVGRDFPFVQYAYSFVLTGDEARYLRRQTDKKLIAKFARPEAFPLLPEIGRGFDELWLCRGDLGVQAGLPALATLQNTFIRTSQASGWESMLAGQVLEHMSHFPEPTRAEVVQLCDALAAGFRGIVLSDETASGKYPEQVADFIDTLRQV
jgi:pyruvate kinase